MLSAKRSRTGSSIYSPAPSSALKRDLLRSFIMFSPVEWTSGYRDAKSAVIVGDCFTQRVQNRATQELDPAAERARYSTDCRSTGNTVWRAEHCTRQTKTDRRYY